MGAFTPGPWRVVTDDCGNIGIVSNNNADRLEYQRNGVVYLIAQMIGGGRGENRRVEERANAWLIAAAPRMYELLQRVGAGDGDWTDEQARAFAIEVREVLSYVDAAATGEQT